MSFCSFSFLLFFTVLFALYYFPCKGKVMAQNVLLLFGSYFFYGYANWKMLPLLVAVTLVYYFLGIGMSGEGDEKKKSVLCTIGIVLGVGLLVYFKYLNFFIDSFASLFESLGLKANIHTFRIIKLCDRDKQGAYRTVQGHCGLRHIRVILPLPNGRPDRSSSISQATG